MNRRNIFKLIGGALCAASIELNGIKPLLPTARRVPVTGIDGVLREHAELIQSQIRVRQFTQSPWIKLVNGSQFPSGMGSNTGKVKS